MTVTVSGNTQQRQTAATGLRRSAARNGNRSVKPSGEILSVHGPEQDCRDETSDAALRDSDRNQLILDHLSFVKHILSRLLNQLPRGIDGDNLESAGVLGLIEAAAQYDPSRNVEFKTFAYRRIRGAILDELRRNCPLSQQMLQKISQLRRIRESLGGSVSIETLADASGMTCDEVLECIQGSRLTRPETWCDSVRVRGHIGDREETSDMEKAEMQRILADGIETLPDRMRTALALHYNEGLKLKEIGDVLGLSESRVSRILDAARTRLQDYVRQLGY
ncbi:MAG: sigma-70 family RNA polymerase sigma factor [Planctomycetaceae bacterium]|nr:sigma-70 family RNA polymerase sigma factor [Planctomycetaceae bacterium]